MWAKLFGMKQNERFGKSFWYLHLQEREIMFDNPMYLGSAYLEKSKHWMYETSNSIVRSHLVGHKLLLPYMMSSSFILSFETNESIRILPKSQKM